MSSKALLEQLKILHEQEKAFIEQERELVSKVTQELKHSQIDSILLLLQGLNQIRKSFHLQFSDMLVDSLSNSILLPFDQTPMSDVQTPAIVSTSPKNQVLEIADTPFIDDFRKPQYNMMPPIPEDVVIGDVIIESNYSPIPILSSPEPMIPMRESKEIDIELPNLELPAIESNEEELNQNYHSLFSELDASIQTPVDDFDDFMPKLPLLDEDEDGDLPPHIGDFSVSDEDLISEEILASLPFIQSHTPITQSNFQALPQQPSIDQSKANAANDDLSNFPLNEMFRTQVGLPNAFVKPLLNQPIKKEESTPKMVPDENFGKTQLFNPELLKRHDTPNVSVDLFPSSIGQLDGGMDIEVIENHEVEEEEIPPIPIVVDVPQVSAQPIQKQINIPIVVKITTQTENKQLICKTLNAGGMFLETPQPYAIGEELFLSFEIAGALIQVWGIVRWVRNIKNATLDQPAGMGISFMGLKDEDKIKIERFS